MLRNGSQCAKTAAERCMETHLSPCYYLTPDSPLVFYATVLYRCLARTSFTLFRALSDAAERTHPSDRLLGREDALATFLQETGTNGKAPRVQDCANKYSWKLMTHKGCDRAPT
eukprot:4766501-Amphidinium_carterae.2